MIRFLFYLGLLGFLVWGSFFLSRYPGEVFMQWPGWEIRVSMTVYIGLFLLYTTVLWGVFRLYHWLRWDNPLTGPKRRQRQNQAGMAELDRGWSALAVEEVEKARKYGKKAMKLLPGHHEPLRLLLACPDVSPADKAARPPLLTRLEADPNSRLWALKDRWTTSMAQGLPDEALAILKNMKELRPNAPWILDQLFHLLARLSQWDAALAALPPLVKAGVLDKTGEKHQRAVLYFCKAQEADLAGHKAGALDFVRQSLRHDPAFVPAVLLVGQLYIGMGDKNKARKAIEAAWRLRPHPEPGQLFLNLEPLESPSEKFHRLEKLVLLNSDHRVSRHLLARVALETGHWAAAKEALDLVRRDKQESRESADLLAQLATAQDQDQSGTESSKAAAAHVPEDPHWSCGACGHRLEQYKPLCPHCQRFGQVVFA